MTIPYTDEYLREMYVELGYSDIMPLYEFLNRVENGSLDIPTERTDND